MDMYTVLVIIAYTRKNVPINMQYSLNSYLILTIHLELVNQDNTELINLKQTE